MGLMGFTFHDSVIAHMIPEKSINNAYIVYVLYPIILKKSIRINSIFFQQYFNIYVKYHIIYKYLILNHFFLKQKLLKIFVLLLP